MLEFSFFHLIQEFVKYNLLLFFIYLLVLIDDIDDKILFRFDYCHFVCLEHTIQKLLRIHILKLWLDQFTRDFGCCYFFRHIKWYLLKSCCKVFGLCDLFKTTFWIGCIILPFVDGLEDLCAFFIQEVWLFMQNEIFNFYFSSKLLNQFDK